MEVLVVDDDPVARRLLERLLGAASDVEVVGFAAAAEEAAVLAEVLQPEVVLLDLHLGAQDGRDLIGSLALAAPDALLVVLTAMADEEAEASSLAAGAHLFRSKSTATYLGLVDDLRAALDRA